MPPITLEAIHAKQTELEAMIKSLQHEATKVTFVQIEEATISLQPGEHYAGAVLDANGAILHHLVLMATRPEKKLAWQAAMDWAASIGGVLPTRQELSLLFANCKPHLNPSWHLSSETYEDDASCAWGCYFSYGTVDLSHKGYEGSAVAVRRV